MLPETIAQIILRVLDITFEFVKHMPEDQHAAMWAQHQENLKFWQGVIKKFDKE